MKLFVSRKKYEVSRGGIEIDDAILTTTQSGAAKIEWPLERYFLRVMCVMATIALFILGGRVMYLNVIKGADYQEAASRNSLRKLVIPAPRGIIYDRFGKELVSNAPSMDAILIPADIPTDSGAVETMKSNIATTFGLERAMLDDVFSKLDRKSLSAVLLKERVTQDDALIFLSRRKELPGVSLFQTMHRKYADSLIFSHVMGYEGKIHKDELVEHPEYLLTDSIGKQGIERSYEQSLRGTHGFRQVEVDALGHVRKEFGAVASVPGNDLILHIDAELQKTMFDSLQSFIEKKGIKKAAAIAIDPRNGAVRGLVSVPSYDNNMFADGISAEEYRTIADDPAQPLFNRAISGAYPPGSTLKPVIAAAALAEGVIGESTQIESRGGISVGRFFFGDWKVHGYTDIRRALAVSSDVFFYSVGGGYGGIRGLGMEIMKRYELLFGYGGKTGIDLPGEEEGLIPDPVWKQSKIGERWYIGDDYHASIGQGFVTATPLQIVNSIAAIANGGTLYAPRLVSQIRSVDGKVTTVPPHTLRENFIDKNILRIVREGMRLTVTEGTAQALKSLPVAVAGKTGTAQFGTQKKTHGWFVSFAPYESPELAMIVLVEDQDEEGYNAVPVTQEVYDWYFARQAESGSSEP